MSKRDISVFTLSLLDVLFCAFGGVIVLTVVFSAIIKYEQAQDEESRYVAIILTMNYKNPKDVPPLWRLMVRKVPPNQSLIEKIEEPLKIFKQPGYTFYKQMQPSIQGSYTIGFEGELVVNKQESDISDTLYLRFYYDLSETGGIGEPENKLRSNSGEWIISANIFRPGQLPLSYDMTTIPATQLNSVDNWIEIIVKLEGDELSIVKI